MYKDVNGAMTYFQWDGDNIWGLAANVSNGLTHYYYRGLDGVIKENYGAVYVYNGHGDVVKMTNSNGAVTKDYEYDAFGVIEDENAADINPWRYCGEYYDAETGNIYLRARYYDPSIGSFITEDPARDGTNWYSYCGGNPVNLSDPSGMFDEHTRLKYGDKNADVAVLQNALHREGFSTGDDEKGVFGNGTRSTVERYKFKMKLDNTGENENVVGIYTWRSLKLGVTYYSAAPVTSVGSDENVNCYSFAMGAEGILMPGDISGTDVNYSFDGSLFILGVVQAMDNDIKVISGSDNSYVRIVSSEYVPDSSNEYLVAFRYKGYTYLSGAMNNIPDCHFMTQTVDGRWAGKNGTGSLTIVDSGMPNYSDWHFDSPGAITTYAVVHLAGYKSVGGGW